MKCYLVGDALGKDTYTASTIDYTDINGDKVVDITLQISIAYKTGIKEKTQLHSNTKRIRKTKLNSLTLMSGLVGMNWWF